LWFSIVKFLSFDLSFLELLVLLSWFLGLWFGFSISFVAPLYNY
jgi:hypothetical protein